MKIPIEEIQKIYDRFGISPHEVPANLQSRINDMAKEIIKLKKKKKS